MMSTRSNVIVEDGFNRIQLYRHCDGYPGSEAGVLATLELALPYTWPFPRFEAADFSAAIVRAWKDQGGGNIYIDGSVKGWERVHGDTEWVYVIKPRKKAKIRHGFIDSRTGEPIVEVYDWHDYWFDKANPLKVKPRPILSVRLSEARKAGLSFKR